MTNLLLRAVLGLLGRTWRVRVVAGEETRARLVRDAGSTPCLLTLWHNRLVIAAPCLRSLLQDGVGITVLISASRDGQLGADLTRSWGYDVVRGSSSRGRTAALRGLMRAARRGSAPLVIPDGPRGPVYELKPGLVQLAQRIGTPVVALGFAADRAWRLSSWDRLIIPKPFARVAIAYGDPVHLDPDGDLDAAQETVTEALDRTTARACEALGQGFPENELRGSTRAGARRR